MIKIFSNKTTSPKIYVESKFVINKTTVKNSSYILGFTKNDLLFVKLTFEGLLNTQKINQITLHMMCANAYIDTGVKVIKCNTTNISNASLKTLASSLDENEEVIEKNIIYGEGTSLRKPGDRTFSLDLTNAIKDEIVANPTIMIAISFPYGLSSSFKLYAPDALAENSEICFATMSEIVGLSNLYTYDEHDLGCSGKVKINLATGKALYLNNIIESVSKKIPINFSVYQNIESQDETQYFHNKVIPNFSYRFYKDNDDYVLVNPTGYKSYYKKVEYTSENKDEVLGKLQIKHSATFLANENIIYQSLEDYSYIYVKEESEIKVHLYDKMDNHTYFVINSNHARIQYTETALGYRLTYTWSNDKLEKIESSDNEEMLVNYTSDGYIQKVLFPAINRYVSYIENIQNQTLNIKTYCNINEESSSDTTVTQKIINSVTLTFNANLLLRVTDDITGYYLRLIYNSNNQVVSSSIYNKEGTEKQFENNYIYGNKFTKVTNIEGHNLFYHFDSYGKIKTIMDDNARTITYNYDVEENGESYHLSGISNIQNNARNLLENHSFENENIFQDINIGWQKNGCESLVTKIIEDGVLGEKCLKIETINTDETKIYQNIIKPKSGAYVLKGFIKHQDITNLNTLNLKVGIKVSYKINEENNVVTHTDNKYAILDFTKTNWYQFKTVTLNIPTNAYNILLTVELVVDHLTTTIYLDDMQLTNSAFFARYNLIENGYMEFLNASNLPYGFEFENLDAEDSVISIASDDIHAAILGNNVLKIASGDVSKASIGHTYKIKKIKKEIITSGLAGEKLIFSVFAKGCVSNNIIFRAYIKFTYENKGIKYSLFDFDKHFDNWQMLTRDVIAEDNFSKIEVGIEYDGGSEILLDAFQLYKDSYGKYYNYDIKGNITEIINESSNSFRITYNSDNKIDEIYSTDGQYFKYQYDTKGRILSTKDINGNEIKITYDADDRIIKVTYNLATGEKINTITTYDDATNQETITNEYGNTLVKGMDIYNRIISLTQYNGLSKEYVYNEKSSLEKMYATINNVTNFNSFSYDKYGNTKKIKASNGTEYDVEYDTFGKILSIKCNDNYLEKYQYDALVNGYKKRNLLEKKLGCNGDIYEFAYNNLNQVINIKLNGNSIVNYSYDENGNIYELNDVKNNTSTYFSYDLNGNLIKKKVSNNNEISYIYDNLNNIQKVTYDINSSIRSINYEYDYELNEYSKEGFFNRIANMYGDEIIISTHGANGQFGAEYIYTCSLVKDATFEMNVFEFSDKYDFINYKMETFNTNRTSGIVNGKIFSKESWNQRFRYNKTFYMFVKVSGSYAKENIFTFGLCSETQAITIYSHLCFNNDGTLGYYTTSTDLITPINDKVKLNEWNLIGIKLFKTNNKYYGTIILNDKMSSLFEIDTCVENINYLLVANQTNLFTNTSSNSSSVTSTTTASLTMPFKICFMSFGSYEYTKNDFKAIYSEGLRYLLGNKISKSNSTIYYDEKAYENFDVITLNGTFESLKGIKPTKIAIIDKSYRFDKTRMFKYDTILKRHVFGSYDSILNLSGGNTASLVYKLPLENQGTLSLRFMFAGNTNICHQLLSLCDNSLSETLGIFIDQNNELVVSINQSIVASTNIKTIEDNKWYHLLIRFKAGKLQIYLDTIDTPLYDDNITINFTNKLLYLGNDSNAYYPLNGSLEMLSFKNSFALDTEINKIFNEGKTIVIRNEIDSISRLTNNKIIINDKEIVTKYQYDKTRINKQILPNNETISYTYDVMNNIKSKEFIKNGVTSKVEYEYDTLGRLTKETFEDGRIEKFSYYQNGNIQYRTISKNNEQLLKEEYIYDSIIKDKLLRIVNVDTNATIQNISYDTNDVFKPCSMIINNESKTLAWEGKRLKRIGVGNQYDYNFEGIRIRKITPFESTSFELEGSNIISMQKMTTSENVRLDFVYDSSSLLISLNTSEGNYFYIRDITGNILGIIDKNGNCIVKYFYDAWGNILSKEILIDCIASRHNPFVYKGYYLDEESNFYYLKSRYYSPMLHRFISADNINYLDIESFGGLNLYAYCGNNPISQYDPNGNFVLSFLIGLGIYALAGALVGAFSYTMSEGISYIITGESTWSWAQFTGNVLGGAIGGAFSFIFPSASLASAFVTSATSSAIGMMLQNKYEGTDYSAWRILFESAVNGLISIGTAYLSDVIKINGFNRGKNSYEAIFRSISTKFKHGNISRISFNTFSKILTYNMLGSLIGNYTGGFIDAYNERIQNEMMVL